MSTVYDNLTTDYLSQFNQPLSISAMNKLDQFPFLQKLNYGAQIGNIKQDFHGLADFNFQMAQYSSTQGLLGVAWNLIKQLAPKNLIVDRGTYTDPQLGQVGLIFQSIPNFSQVFSVSQQDLSSASSLAAKVGL